MPEEMSIRCPLKVSGRRKYMEDLPRDKNRKRREEKNLEQKKQKEFYAKSFSEEIFGVLRRKNKK